MNFYRVPFFLPWLYPSLIWRIPTSEKEIFLTFDDGPIEGPTDFVLEQLKSFNAQATFFCIGDNVRKHAQVFRRVVQAGHATGNHTFNHLKGWNTWRDDYLSNIRLCDEQMASEGATPSRIFRPPYGRIKRSQIGLLKDYRIVMWDVLTHDYAQALSPDKCLRGSIAATRPGSIVVFHDSFKAERNMNFVLPRYLEYFSEKGYKFRTLPL
ncbi:MAG: polysaccharide deacetylase family protein [Bacteroidetes bacterium]|nr:polysaccharide deacetylase family protein [Bacteroidota bacterium]